jgi:hypothetical protein
MSFKTTRSYWGPHSLVPSEYPGLLPRRQTEGYHSLPPVAMVKKVWSFKPHICLYGIWQRNRYPYLIEDWRYFLDLSGSGQNPVAGSYAQYNERPLDTILSHLHPAPILTTYFPKIHLIMSGSRTRRFNIANITARHWTRSWAITIQLISLKSRVISSHSLCGLPSCRFPGCFPTDTHRPTHSLPSPSTTITAA